MNALTAVERRACSEAMFLARADEFAQKRFATKLFCDDLSIRESTVLRMMGKGLSVEEISGLIGCTVNTTRSHLRNIYSKLGVNSSIQAICIGLQLGLVRS
jgi:DNA-binding NarL/FixJ family response regulator